MTLTEEQRNEFVAASEPLMKWLSDNCHPHTTVIVGYNRAELVECVTTHITAKFIKD